MIHSHQNYIQTETLCTDMQFASQANDFNVETPAGQIHFSVKKLSHEII